MISNRSDILTTERTFSGTQTGSDWPSILASVQKASKFHYFKKEKYFAAINRMHIQDKHAGFYNSVIFTLKSVLLQIKNSVMFFLHYAQITSGF